MITRGGPGIHSDVAHPVGLLGGIDPDGVRVLKAPDTKGKPLPGDDPQYVFYPPFGKCS